MSMISPLSVLEIKSYTTLKQKKKFLNDVVKKVEIHWDNITNTHN
jgi:hypothetical protein